MSDSRSKSEITIDLSVVLMPFTVLLSAVILSVSMYISAGRIGTMPAGDNNVRGANDAVAAAPAVPPAGDPYAAPAAGAEVTTTVDDDAVKGELKPGNVVIVEFSDFECPFCKRFYDETLLQIQQNYIDTGDAALVYRDLPLSFHALAQIQAEAAECAGEEGDDQYYAMHDAIFDGGGKLNADQLKGLAADLGLNTSNFNSCLDNGDQTEEVNGDAADAAAAGVTGTPGFVIGVLQDDGETVIGEKLSGAQPFSVFSATIDKYMNQ